MVLDHQTTLLGILHQLVTLQVTFLLTLTKKNHLFICYCSYMLLKTNCKNKLAKMLVSFTFIFVLQVFLGLKQCFRLLLQSVSLRIKYIRIIYGNILNCYQLQLSGFPLLFGCSMKYRDSFHSIYIMFYV